MRPDKHTIPTRPLVSVLVATHNRPEWMPFFIYQWEKQTMKDFELLIVATENEQIEKTCIPFYDLGVDCDLRWSISSIKDPGVPGKYARALEQAMGHFVVLAGDDDWQHPERLEISVGHMMGRRDIGWVGYPGGYFYNLVSESASKHHTRAPAASTMIASLKCAHEGDFTKDIASDTEWSNGVMDSAPGIVFPTMSHIHSVWMRHSKNITASTGAPMAAHHGYDFNLDEVIKEHDLPFDDFELKELEELGERSREELEISPQEAAS